MRVCFFGLGSIGVRHLINLHKVCEENGLDLNVDAYRTTKRELPHDIKPLINRSVYSDKELLSDYDAIFVTNPTSCHFETLQKNISRSKSAFIEKPLFQSSKLDLKDIAWESNGVYHVASPLRWHPVIRYIQKKELDKTAISVRAICSSYLPNWRKNQDYSKSYSSSRDMGGGVTLDLIHEWDYIVHLWGFPEEVKLMKGKYSKLKIDSDDLAIYLAKYKQMLLELHLDYFGRQAKRVIEIYSDTNKVVGDFLKNCITINGEESIELEETDMYLDEMRSFVKHLLKRSKCSNTPENAWKEIALTEGKLL